MVAKSSLTVRSDSVSEGAAVAGGDKGLFWLSVIFVSRERLRFEVDILLRSRFLMNKMGHREWGEYKDQRLSTTLAEQSCLV